MKPLKARMDIVRYANCWEDPRLLVEGMGPLEGRRILSICSAGDNALALLAAGAREVVAFDVNPAQLACLGLRVGALRTLSHPDLVEFMGAGNSKDHSDEHARSRRLALWQTVRQATDPLTRSFWDARPRELADGVSHAGRFEEFFRTFRRRILPLVHGPLQVSRLLEAKERAEREIFFRERWNNLRWRLLFSVAFSRFSLGRLGRDPSFFQHVSGPVSSRIAQRTAHALVELSTHDNPWLAYILEGSFQRALPPWLEPQAVERLRDRLDHLHPVLGDLETACSHGPFDAANLSDIFEYMAPMETMESAQVLANSLTRQAPVAYWNLLAPRSLARSAPHLFGSSPERARELHERDRAWFYGSFHLDHHLDVR